MGPTWPARWARLWQPWEWNFHGELSSQLGDLVELVLSSPSFAVGFGYLLLLRGSQVLEKPLLTPELKDRCHASS